MTGYGCLKTAAAAFGAELDDGHLSALNAFKALLNEGNAVMNLTAITSGGEVDVKHLLDSLTMVGLLRKYGGGNACGGMTLIDVGTGAGFPGLPIAVVLPLLSCVLTDANGKRVRFVSDCAERLGLTNVKTVKARAEELGRNAEHREIYDFAVSRAVAPMRVLAELTLPLLKVGGVAFAMKGPDCAAEVEEAQKAVFELGGGLSAIESFTLPPVEDGGEPIGRSVVITKKVRQTPPKYPRPYAKIVVSAIK